MASFKWTMASFKCRGSPHPTWGVLRPKHGQEGRRSVTTPALPSLALCSSSVTLSSAMEARRSPLMAMQSPMSDTHFLPSSSFLTTW